MAVMKIAAKPIHAILFDSADVLMSPIAPADASPTEPWRKWFPGPSFEPMVRVRHPGLSLDGLDDAIRLGMEELDRLHTLPIRTLEEETEHFTAFYRIVLNSLGVSDLELARELARVRVNRPSCEPYPEVPGVLKRLYDLGIILGVLSEAWPSLESDYRRLGLQDLFRAFIVSANHGILKDDPRLFSIAQTCMDIPAENTLFLDDWPPYVQVAIQAGFQGAVVARDPEVPRTEDHIYVEDLYEVEQLSWSS